MAMHQIPIPEEYKPQLHYVQAKDKRTDAEILDSLTQGAPITSEKNIWTYWHAGVRLHGSDWTVWVLNTVPDSSNHALAWIAPEELPETFVKGTMTGPYVGPHSANFLRGAALYTYGGVWMDVGNILFRDLDRVCWNQLAEEESPYTVSVPWMFEQYFANHFIAARKGDVFIKKWHELFVHLWKGRTDFTGVIQSPLISFLQNFKFSEAEARGFKWDFKVDEQTALGYIGLRRLVDYWSKKVLLFDVRAEGWAAEQIVGYKGEDLFRVFTTRRDANPESEEYKVAEKTVWRLLTKSTLQKITHGKGLTHSFHCGALLDQQDNEGKGAEPGTFGELLRYGSVHLEQTRESILYVEPIVVAPEFIIHKGLTEA